MPNPKWAPRRGQWGPVKPGFWDVWHANKKSLQRNGYSVRFHDGQWQVRYVPGMVDGWPPRTEPEATYVPSGMKASICLKCGNVRVIKLADPHKDCMCGDKVPAPSAHKVDSSKAA